MTKPVELILIGAGIQGAQTYAPYALDNPQDARFVAVAEPNAARRERFAHAHNIPARRRFTDWRAVFEQDRFADGVLVCTQDQQHVEPTVAALEAGYDVLLEKPMATDLAGCLALVRAVEQTGRQLQVCHGMRYNGYTRKLNEIVQSGRLGDLINVEHSEHVAYWHMTHSFVRGKWRNSAESCPMILAKCCHDLDDLVWNIGRPCTRLSSFGSNRHFRSDQVGAEIPHRCVDNCPIEPECPFSAISIYLDLQPFADDPAKPGRATQRARTISALTDDPSEAGRRRAIEEGPYGRCVYHCDNDVVDHQVVMMEFEGELTVTLTMQGHAHEGYRAIRYDGTHGTLIGRFGAHVSELTVFDHRSDRAEPVRFDAQTSSYRSSDQLLMKSFVQVVRGETVALTSPRESLESHLLAFAAEEARQRGVVVDMNDFRRRAYSMISP